MSRKNFTLRTERNKYKKRKKILLWILTPILLLGLGLTAYGAYLYNKTETVMEKSYNPLNREKKREVSAESLVDNVSVLIIGVDDSSKRGFNDSSRSDALLLATFNKEKKSIKLLSIPRDSYVYIPEVGKKDKINHAHAFGGPVATIETVEKLLDIPVDYYVKLNFNAFIDIIDALDGIEVEVPYTFSEQNSKDQANAITLQKGLQHLNGEQALALARTRKLDSDVERGKRQQEIVKAMINKAISAGSISKYGDVIDAIGKNMETDMTFDHFKAFFSYATAGTSLSVEFLNIEGEDLWLKNKKGSTVYYYGLDENSLNQTKLQLKTHLGLEKPNTALSDTIDEPKINENIN